MSQTKKRIGSLFLVFCMVFAMMPMTAFADSATVDITGEEVSAIKTAIETALDGVSDGETVTVTGTLTGVTKTLSLAIHDTKTVVWAASITGQGDERDSLIILSGSGTFEVATGGSVTATAGTAIYRPSGGPIIIDGGNVTAADSVALSSVGNVTVKSGTVSATGTGRAIGSNGSVTVSGGVVRATTGYAIDAGGNVTVEGDAVVFAYGSDAIAVINNTESVIDGDGIVIWWAKPADGPFTYEAGGSDDIFTWSSTEPTEAVWAKQGAESGIAYTNGENKGFLAIPGVTVNETGGSDPTFTISGTIKGSDTDSGIAGANLELKGQDSVIVATTSTDSTGKYSFPNILPGTYSIEASANYYNTGTLSNVVVSGAHVTGKDLTLTRPDYYGTYGLIVGDVVVTDGNKGNIAGSGITGTISYDSATKTLTLNNATIGFTSYHPIVSTEDITVKLEGNSVLGVKWSDDQESQIGTGISGYKNITLTGDGNLTIYNNESGIQAKNITIDMGGTLTIDELGSSGMACTLKANGGTITINKGTLNLKSKLSNGLNGNSIAINGGNITAYSEDRNNAGLFAFNRAPSFSRDYWYKVSAGNDEASAVDITAPNSRTYTNSKYVRIEQSTEGTGIRGGGHGGGSGSPSGGDSGGSTTPPAPPAPPTSPNVGADGAVSQSTITGEAASALSAAPGTTATVRTQGASQINPATLDALAGAGAQAGRQVVLHADTMTGSAVQGRLYVEPARLTGRTEPLKLGVYTEPAKTAATTGLFERFFDNNITTISLEQQGSFGTSLQIAAKVDLSKLDVTALVFYSYDKATNTYRRIEKPAYWVDTNGYLHFTTELAGDIIISNGPLALK